MLPSAHALDLPAGFSRKRLDGWVARVRSARLWHQHWGVPWSTRSAKIRAARRQPLRRANDVARLEPSGGVTFHAGGRADRGSRAQLDRSTKSGWVNPARTEGLRILSQAMPEVRSSITHGAVRMGSRLEAVICYYISHGRFELRT